LPHLVLGYNNTKVLDHDAQLKMKNLYSLWITPPIKINGPLQKVITDVSAKYGSPEFEPHITLLGNISLDLEPLKQKVGLLVSKLKPFPISFSEVSFSTTYFQSVFVRVKTTAALMNSNMLAKEIYKIDNDVFMPHISLIYGNHDMKTREKIVSEVVLPKDISFEASKLVVTPSTQNPNDWVHIAEWARLVRDPHAQQK
jgi:2'-5' RNA ligase